MCIKGLHVPSRYPIATPNLGGKMEELHTPIPFRVQAQMSGLILLGSVAGFLACAWRADRWLRHGK